MQGGSGRAGIYVSLSVAGVHGIVRWMPWATDWRAGVVHGPPLSPVRRALARAVNPSAHDDKRSRVSGTLRSQKTPR